MSNTDCAPQIPETAAYEKRWSLPHFKYRDESEPKSCSTRSAHLEKTIKDINEDNILDHDKKEEGILMMIIYLFIIPKNN